MLWQVRLYVWSLSQESLPFFFPDDFDIVALILQVLYALMISGTNIFYWHGVSIFVFDSRVNSVFIGELVWMTMPVVTIKFKDGVELLTETVNFVITNFLFSTMKSRLNFNVTFMN